MLCIAIHDDDDDEECAVALIGILPHNVVKRGICYDNICPFVRSSVVTPVSHARTVQDVEILFAPYDGAICIVS